MAHSDAWANMWLSLGDFVCQVLQSEDKTQRESWKGKDWGGDKDWEIIVLETGDKIYKPWSDSEITRLGGDGFF